MESEGLKCAVTAPTGSVSFKIDGVTIRDLFLLPIVHESKKRATGLSLRPPKRLSKLHFVA